MLRACLVAGLVIVAVVAAALTFMLVQKRGKSSAPSVTLGDGTILTLESATFGKSHTYRTGSRWVGWAANFFPKSSALGRRLAANGYQTGSTTVNDALMLWFTRFDRSTGLYSSADWQRVEVLDSHGCRWTYQGMSTMGQPSYKVSCASFEAFPRREREFKVRLIDRQDQLMAEFMIANPAFSSSPPQSWVPEALPASRTNGDLTFTLRKLRAYEYPQGNYTTAEFQVKRGDEELKDWGRREVQLIDVLGNISSQVLCTNESAWRVVAQVSRDPNADFAPDESWRVGDVTIPEAGRFIAMARTNRVRNLEIAVLGIAGPGTYTWSNGVMTMAFAQTNSSGMSSSSGSDMTGRQWRVVTIQTQRPFVLLEHGPATAQERLYVRITDASNRRWTTQGGSLSNDRHYANLDRVASGQTVALEMIVDRARKVEYTVAPPRLRPAQ